MRPLILALCLGLMACGKPYIKPSIETVSHRAIVPVPIWLTQEQPVPALRDGTVYSREEQRRILLDIVSTYAYRMKLIRGLPTDDR